MSTYFNIKLEFNQEIFNHTLDVAIKDRQKGYVCVVDANVLTIGQKDKNYREILNNSIINCCDGSSIAWLAGLLHKKKYKAFNGPEIFEIYIEKKYKQLLLGSTEPTVEKIKKKLILKGIEPDHLSFMQVPFMPVDEFDYEAIALEINHCMPEIIWVSLGAPKQEIFMSKLLPHINSGIMFGIGAAFNFYVGEIVLPKTRLGTLRFIWLSRIFSEPKKQITRVLPYLYILPKLWWQERKKIINERSL
ncbi:WecB/TagA/CpsF family glycosyltransferase [Roseimarinus sediminis]|uniref:WecB/TagA/CpsF family glycosyltransferase n=1 Tax=Roseimarinus sediminis TaxID=1610899 RepID=UPI003D1A2153